MVIKRSVTIAIAPRKANTHSPQNIVGLTLKKFQKTQVNQRRDSDRSYSY